MKVTTNTVQFEKDMKNVIDYSLGFIEGIEKGKVLFYNSLGNSVTEILKRYIDSNARANPEILHHMYEWNQVGNSTARLFDINYRSTQLGLSVNSTFRQSNTIKPGSYEPFYSKAKIMEEGVPVTIRPVRSKVLAFDLDGETVFTPNEIVVDNPGGPLVAGSFEKIFKEFFSFYFTQAFMNSSGIAKHLSNPIAFKTNFGKGKGRSAGVSAAQQWLLSAGRTIIE